MDVNYNSEYSPRNGNLHSPRDTTPNSKYKEISNCHSKQMPAWKKQIRDTKIKKEKEKRAEEYLEEQRKKSSDVPEWKKAIMMKRQELMKTTDDPYLLCKRKIQVLEKEIKDPQLPPWKVEVLQIKLKKVKAELAEMEGEKFKKEYPA